MNAPVSTVISSRTKRSSPRSSPRVARRVQFFAQAVAGRAQLVAYRAHLPEQPVQLLAQEFERNLGHRDLRR
jgi:hypothetical protein